MKTVEHYCSVCNENVFDYCHMHPKATIDSIVVDVDEENGTDEKAEE